MDTKAFNAMLILAMAFANSWSLNVSAGYRRQLRTLSGRDVRPGEFPFVVRVELHFTETITIGGRELKLTSFMHSCTASVLSATVSLTAGHCCLAIPGFDYNNNRASVKTVIRYGSAPGRPEWDYRFEKFSNVLQCTQLPSARNVYNPTMTDDLAILRTEPIALSNYGKVSARDYRVLYGQRVALLGYGITIREIFIGSTLDLHLPLQVLDGVLLKCHEALDDLPMNIFLGMNYPVVCAAHPCGRPGAVCPGDSGGPVVHASGIVGVISKTAPPFCFKTPIPGVSRVQGIIAPLSSNLDWISETIKKFEMINDDNN